MRSILLALAGCALVALTLPLGFGDHSSTANQTTVQAATLQGLAEGNDLYCAGFISAEPVLTKLEIAGGEEKAFQSYSPSHRAIYLNEGDKDGVKVGELYEVTRPTGKFQNQFSKKSLGYMNQEIGLVKVTSVHDFTSVATVIFACVDLNKGDRLVKFERRTGPDARPFEQIDRYSDNYMKSNELLGQIVAMRYDQQLATERSIVHLDIGDDDGVKVGDYFTVLNRSDGMTLKQFASSRSSGQVKDIPATDERGKAIKQVRQLPAHVAGELAVIHVEKKSATAIVTRNVDEITNGDFVQRK